MYKQHRMHVHAFYACMYAHTLSALESRDEREGELVGFARNISVSDKTIDY